MSTNDAISYFRDIIMYYVRLGSIKQNLLTPNEVLFTLSSSTTLRKTPETEIISFNVFIENVVDDSLKTFLHIHTHGIDEIVKYFIHSKLR
jgi:hypothetical protein